MQSLMTSSLPEPGPSSFEIRSNAARGRHMVATRPIREGAIIFSERALVIATYPGKEVSQPAVSLSLTQLSYQKAKIIHR